MSSILCRAIGTLIDLATPDLLINGVMADSYFLDIVYGENHWDSFDGFSRLDIDRLRTINTALIRVKRCSKHLTLEGKGKLFLRLMGM